MKRAAFVFGMIIVIIIILADTRKLGFIGFLYEFPYGDKVGHFLIYGLFSLVVNLSVFESRSISKSSTDPVRDFTRSAIISSLIIAAFVGLEELSQLWFTSRSSSIYDFLASCLGISFFTWFYLSLIKKEQVLDLLMSMFRDKPV